MFMVSVLLLLYMYRGRQRLWYNFTVLYMLYIDILHEARQWQVVQHYDYWKTTLLSFFLYKTNTFFKNFYFKK